MMELQDTAKKPYRHKMRIRILGNLLKHQKEDNISVSHWRLPTDEMYPIPSNKPALYCIYRLFYILPIRHSWLSMKVSPTPYNLLLDESRELDNTADTVQVLLLVQCILLAEYARMPNKVQRSRRDSTSSPPYYLHSLGHRQIITSPPPP